VIHAYPGVINQNVELPKVVYGAVHERSDLGFLLHVRFDEHDVATMGLNLGGDALAALDITVGKSHLRPFGDEAPHRGLPNPRRAARDGGHFPPELSHRHSPLVCVMPDPVRTLGAADTALEPDDTGECRAITRFVPLTARPPCRPRCATEPPLGAPAR
jgi:hypothetical protein